MIILTLRTDKPQAELALYDDHTQVAGHSWEAHRQLGETLHVEIKQILDGQAKDWSDIQGIVCYQGPGSFTGLRIGLSVANALAASLPAVIVGTAGDDWIADGLKLVLAGKNNKVVLPEYGAPVHITQPKK